MHSSKRSGLSAPRNCLTLYLTESFSLEHKKIRKNMGSEIEHILRSNFYKVITRHILSKAHKKAKNWCSGLADIIVLNQKPVLTFTKTELLQN